ncbi:MAG: hypothetical protein JRN22_05275 [Nitrososphaerota archaeon]|nr:hypothetical protein [Nitrososphaerota archaeon]
MKCFVIASEAAVSTMPSSAVWRIRFVLAIRWKGIASPLRNRLLHILYILYNVHPLRKVLFNLSKVNCFELKSELVVVDFSGMRRMPSSQEIYG